MKISLFASAIRPHLWTKFLRATSKSSIEHEIIFVGGVADDIVKEIGGEYPNFKYVKTENIKPAQCYEVGRRNCIGEVILWCSDDFLFPENGINKIYEAWKSYDNDKVILALNTHDPNSNSNILNEMRFYTRNLNTPQMAPAGCMSREYLERLGGLDKRYLFGHWESDICMRTLADGGWIYRYEDIVIDIDRTNKNSAFNNNWSGVNEDREILENSWVIGGYKEYEKPFYAMIDNKNFIYYPITNYEVTLRRNDEFQPYIPEKLTLRSQGLRGKWQ